MVKAESPRILVVDDDLSAALGCTYLLLDAGFEVDIATTPSDALRLLVERLYVAALVDLVMPDLGGRQVCRAVHALAPESALIVAGEDPESVARPLEPDQYLHRPFTPGELLEAVAKALARARGRTASVVASRSSGDHAR
jgi:DNA-binding response OmpR family regulator